MTDTLRWEGEPLSISNSELQLFKDCRRTWYLTYYLCLGLKSAHKEISGARSLGNRIHETLDSAYTTDVNPLVTLKDVYERDKKSFQVLETPEPQIMALEKEFGLAHAMISGFVEWIEENGIDDGLEVVAVEDIIRVASNVPGVFWKAKLDQRIERKSDGARLFRDWKTVQNLTDPPKLLIHNEQMKFYHLLEMLDARQKTGGDPQWRTDGALYFMLRKVKRTAAAKPPFFGQLEVQHNTSTIRNHYLSAAKTTEEIVQTRMALDAGGDFHYLCPARPDPNWTWKNDFLPIISLMDDGSDWRGMAEEYYEVINPDARYEVESRKGS